MNLVFDILGSVFLLSGTVVCIIGGIGLIRMPSFFARVHAASVPDTLGVSLALIGMVFITLSTSWADPSYPAYTWDLKALIIVKLVFIGAFVLVSSPIAGHALSKSAYQQGVDGSSTTERQPNWKTAEEIQQEES